MRTLLLLLFLLQIPGPHLEAHWQGNTLLVIASPGSLYLVGEAYGEQYVGQELITLRDRAIDARQDPTNYEAIELRGSSGQVIVSLPIPDKPPDQWLMILPLIDAPEGGVYASVILQSGFRPGPGRVRADLGPDCHCGHWGVAGDWQPSLGGLSKDRRSAAGE